MVYKTLSGRWIGVLNDFDLSLTQDSPSGQERTGTVPFMAIEILSKDAIEGKVKHLYRHDAESLLWVLTCISLRYKEGRLLRKGRPLDEWLKLDAIECHDKKTGFLTTHRHKMKPSRSRKRSWKVVRLSLKRVGMFYAHNHPAAESVDSELEDTDDSKSDGFGDDSGDDSGDIPNLMETTSLRLAAMHLIL
jgi:hypothetical protein